MKSLEVVLTRTVSHNKVVPVMIKSGLCLELTWDLNQF